MDFSSFSSHPPKNSILINSQCDLVKKRFVVVVINENQFEADDLKRVENGFPHHFIADNLFQSRVHKLLSFVSFGRQEFALFDVSFLIKTFPDGNLHFTSCKIF
jgi:hypothetical protein